MQTEFSASDEAVLVSTIPRLRRYARSLTKDIIQAEDLVQEALCRAMENWSSYKNGTNIQAWMITICRNLFISECRRKKKWLNAQIENQPELGVCPNAEHRLELEDMERALFQMPAEMRDVVALVAIEGFTYEDAAQILSIPVGTVRSRLSRARSKLSSDLEDSDRETDSSESNSSLNTDRYGRTQLVH